MSGKSVEIHIHINLVTETERLRLAGIQKTMQLAKDAALNDIRRAVCPQCGGTRYFRPPYARRAEPCPCSEGHASAEAPHCCAQCGGTGSFRQPYALRAEPCPACASADSASNTRSAGEATLEGIQPGGLVCEVIFRGSPCGDLQNRSSDLSPPAYSGGKAHPGEASEPRTTLYGRCCIEVSDGSYRGTVLVQGRSPQYDPRPEAE